MRKALAALGVTTVEQFLQHDFTQVPGRLGEYLRTIQQRANLMEIMAVLT